MRIISATELARNTRKILDDVAGRGESVSVERNNVTVAKIVPPELSMTAAQALAGLGPLLGPVEGKAWLRDSRGDFSQKIDDPWA